MHNDRRHRHLRERSDSGWNRDLPCSMMGVIRCSRTAAAPHMTRTGDDFQKTTISNARPSAWRRGSRWGQRDERARSGDAFDCQEYRQNYLTALEAFLITEALIKALWEDDSQRSSSSLPPVRCQRHLRAGILLILQSGGNATWSNRVWDFFLLYTAKPTSRQRSIFKTVFLLVDDNIDLQSFPWSSSNTLWGGIKSHKGPTTSLQGKKKRANKAWTGCTY